MARRTSADMHANLPTLKARMGPPPAKQVVTNTSATADPGSSALQIGHTMSIERVDGGAIVETRKIGDYHSPAKRKLVNEEELTRMLPKGS